MIRSGLHGFTLTPNPLLGLCSASRVVEEAIESSLAQRDAISEPWVARHICNAALAGPTAKEVCWTISLHIKKNFWVHHIFQGSELPAAAMARDPMCFSLSNILHL